ncbi:OmpA family protein [Oceanimonas pelagia]|uniref:OmpA family protein n=1 Tax=Oceanimonas pelagia TaxID=3028314 RepID=A0AA50KS63_9GAMM|nr:OmpA family protein [Oceanimonas pelagia]WMC12110.1 OmpA family protein [Oceanimonas pelagia]
MNMLKKAPLVAIMGATLLPAVAMANMHGHSSIGPNQGDREFSLSGTGSSSKDFDNSSFGISADYGWYLSDRTLAGIRQSISYADVEGEGLTDDFWNGSTRGFVDYHFGQNAARPFVGASLGAIYGDGVNDTGIAGLEAGLKYYLLPTTFIQARAEYQFLFDSGDSASDNFDDGAWAYTFGMGLNF